MLCHELIVEHCRIVALLIAALEATYLVPAVERALDFFLESYLWRAIAYIMYVEQHQQAQRHWL
jgi:hypothetical protein